MKRELSLPFETLWRIARNYQKKELEVGEEIQWPFIFLEFLENPEQYIKNNNLIEYLLEMRINFSEKKQKHSAFGLLDENDSELIPDELIEQFMDVATILSIKSITFDSYYAMCKDELLSFILKPNVTQPLIQTIVAKYFVNRNCGFQIIHLILESNVHLVQTFDISCFPYHLKGSILSSSNYSTCSPTTLPPSIIFKLHLPLTPLSKTFSQLNFIPSFSAFIPCG